MATTVVVYAEDLLSGLQVRDTAQKLGYSAKTAEALPELIQEIISSPQLLLVDASVQPDWSWVVGAARAHRVPVVAFGNHTDLVGRERALAAGVDAVVANSLVATDLAGIIRRYARPPDRGP